MELEFDKELKVREIFELQEFLSRVPDRPIQNAEALDGFFAALVCCPEIIGPNEFMPALLNIGLHDYKTKFVEERGAEQFAKLVGRQWHQVSLQLGMDEDYFPLVLTNKEGKFRANDWAKGFLQGMNLRETLWFNLVNTQEGRNYMIPIWALANEHHENPEARPFKEPITEEARTEVLRRAVDGVMGIHKYFRKQQNRNLQHSKAFTRSNRKSSRNDPCTCGSGKKFKQCCGRRPLRK